MRIKNNNKTKKLKYPIILKKSKKHTFLYYKKYKYFYTGTPPTTISKHSFLPERVSKTRKERKTETSLSKQVSKKNN